MKKTLNDLVEGDWVIEDESNLRKVDKITNYRIKIGNRSFWKKDGRIVGSTRYFIHSIKIPTDEQIAECKKRNVITNVRAMLDKMELTYEQSLAIFEIISKK